MGEAVRLIVKPSASLVLLTAIGIEGEAPVVTILASESKVHQSVTGEVPEVLVVNEVESK
jgi:hypothetical protein